MLNRRQFAICALLALTFWVLATLAIRYVPGSITDPAMGAIGFAVSIPVGWACLRLTRRLAVLQPWQLPAACLVVIAIATAIDGAALRFLPRLYSADEHTCRLAAAWLLWGYGVSAFAALAMASVAGGEMVGRAEP